MRTKEHITMTVPESMYGMLKTKGNMSEYVLTQLYTYGQEYGALSKPEVIVNGERRNKQLWVSFNDKMVKRLEEQSSRYGIPWKEYAKRLVLQILTDKQMRKTSTASVTSPLIQALTEYLKSETDEDIVLQAELLKEMVEAKERKNRYIRLIPEIQTLMAKGITAEDITETLKVMGNV